MARGMWRYLSVVAVLVAVVAHGATVATFTGGDAGEGLDLDGTFPYAINCGQAGSGIGPDVTVRDAVFKDDYGAAQLIPGVTAFGRLVGPWSTAPEYGVSGDDNNLETVMHSIMYRGMTAPNAHRNDYVLDVVPGWRYRLQVILNENHFATAVGEREQDILLYGGTFTADPVGEGRTIYGAVSNVNVIAIVGKANALAQGVVVTIEFLPTDNQVTLWGRQVAAPSGGLDEAGIFNGVTLEEVTATPQVSAFSSVADLELRAGDTVYAVNVSSGGASPLSVNGLEFLRCGASGTDVPGVTVSSLNALDNWAVKPEYGATADSDNLEEIMHDIRYSVAPGTVTVDAAVVPGKIYDLRLLFSEGHFSAVGERAFDVRVEGYRIADEFDILATAGAWIGMPRTGAEIAYSFVAEDANLEVELTPGSTLPDMNPVLNAFVLSVKSRGTVFVLR